MSDSDPAHLLPFILSNRSVGGLIHKQTIIPLHTWLCSNWNTLLPIQVNVNNGVSFQSLGRALVGEGVRRRLWTHEAVYVLSIYQDIARLCKFTESVSLKRYRCDLFIVSSIFFSFFYQSSSIWRKNSMLAHFFSFSFLLSIGSCLMAPPF